MRRNCEGCLSQSYSKLQSLHIMKDQKREKLKELIVVAVADPQNGFTSAFFLRKDKHGSCEYLFHTREPVSNDEEKVIFQQKNVCSALKFWQDVLVCDGNVFLISDLPEEHFSQDIRVILHQLELKRESKGFTKEIQIVAYDPVYYVAPPPTLLSLPTHEHVHSSSRNAQIEGESWLPILQICQNAAQALATGNIVKFKQLLIGNQINVRKFARVSQ